MGREADFEDERGVRTLVLEDGKKVFSIDGTHFELGEAEERLEEEGHNIHESTEDVEGVSYTVVVE